MLPSVPISPVYFFSDEIFDHFKSYYMVGGEITQSSNKTGKGSWRVSDWYLIKIEERLGLYIFKYLKSSMLLTHIVHWDQCNLPGGWNEFCCWWYIPLHELLCYLLSTHFVQLKINSCWHLQKYRYLYWQLTSLLGLIRMWMSTLIGMQPEFYRNGVWYESHLWHSTGNGREEELGLFQFQCSSVFSFFHFDSLKSQLFNKNNNNKTILILL